MPGFGAAGVRDITVDGFDGKQIEYTVPDYNEDECRGGRFGMLQKTIIVVRVMLRVSGRRPPNQHNQVWIIDVDGTRLVILAGYFPNISAQDRTDLDEILSSIQIG